MRNIALGAEFRKVAAELRSNVATDGRGPAERAEPRCQDIDDGVSGEGAESMEKGYPLQWSTQMRNDLPPKLKRSRPMCCMG